MLWNPALNRPLVEENELVPAIVNAALGFGDADMLSAIDRATKSALSVAAFKVPVPLLMKEPTGEYVSVPRLGGRLLVALPVIQWTCLFGSVGLNVNVMKLKSVTLAPLPYTPQTRPPAVGSLPLMVLLAVLTKTRGPGAAGLAVAEPVVAPLESSIRRPEESTLTAQNAPDNVPLPLVWFGTVDAATKLFGGEAWFNTAVAVALPLTSVPDTVSVACGPLMVPEKVRDWKNPGVLPVVEPQLLQRNAPVF